MPIVGRSLSARYADVGRKFGSFVGLVGALAYAMSPANPNRGNLLDLKQDAILFAIVLCCNLVGSGIGYALGKIADRNSSKEH